MLLLLKRTRKKVRLFRYGIKLVPSPRRTRRITAQRRCHPSPPPSQQPERDNPTSQSKQGRALHTLQFVLTGLVQYGFFPFVLLGIFGISYQSGGVGKENFGRVVVEVIVDFFVVAFCVGLLGRRVFGVVRRWWRHDVFETRRCRI